MTKTIKYTTTEEGLRLAFREIAELNRVVVEMQGRLEGSRYAFHALCFCLETADLADRKFVASALDAGARGYEGAVFESDADESNNLRRRTALEEMKAISAFLRMEDGPAFTVIDGGKD